MTQPLISVLMPVYNVRRYVGQAVESILGQTLDDFEFIIVDDGSTDGSTEILQRYAARDQRIRLISRPNTGYVRALNEGLALARGEFVARMDADDVSLPHRFAHQVETLRARPEVVVLGGAVEYIDGAGRLLLRSPAMVTDEQLQADLLAGRCTICHPATMIRRAAMVAVGGYDEDFLPAEDIDLWLRLGEVGQLANTAELILQYRIHDKSVSSTQQNLQAKKCFRACEQAWKRRGLPPPRQFDVNRRWRPDRTRESRHEFIMKYGWWAFSNDERVGAMVYGARAIALLPLRPDGWRLLACAVIKPRKPARTDI